MLAEICLLKIYMILDETESGLKLNTISHTILEVQVSKIGSHNSADFFKVIRWSITDVGV